LAAKFPKDEALQNTKTHMRPVYNALRAQIGMAGDRQIVLQTTYYTLRQQVYLYTCESIYKYIEHWPEYKAQKKPDRPRTATTTELATGLQPAHQWNYNWRELKQLREDEPSLVDAIEEEWNQRDSKPQNTRPQAQTPATAQAATHSGQNWYSQNKGNWSRRSSGSWETNPTWDHR
jgi:hypothetical protein